MVGACRFLRPYSHHSRSPESPWPPAAILRRPAPLCLSEVCFPKPSRTCLPCRIFGSLSREIPNIPRAPTILIYAGGTRSRATIVRAYYRRNTCTEVQAGDLAILVGSGETVGMMAHI